MSLSSSPALEEKTPVNPKTVMCQDFLTGKCIQTDCPYFHIGKDRPTANFPNNFTLHSIAFYSPNDDEIPIKKEDAKAAPPEEYIKFMFKGDSSCACTGRDCGKGWTEMNLEFCKELTKSYKQLTEKVKINVRDEVMRYDESVTNNWEKCKVIEKHSSGLFKVSTATRFFTVLPLGLTGIAGNLANVLVPLDIYNSYQPLKYRDYEYNFLEMTQKNLETNKVRYIGTHGKIVVPKKEETVVNYDVKPLLPVFHDCTRSLLTSAYAPTRDKLDPKSDEFKLVKGRFYYDYSGNDKKLKPHYIVKQILKNKNPYLAKLYELKKAEILKNPVKDANHPRKEIMLFHGTRGNSMDDAMNEGLDVRLANNGYFGTGIYGSMSPAYCDKYRTTMADGNLSFFMVKFLVGNPYDMSGKSHNKSMTDAPEGYDSVVADVDDNNTRNYTVYDNSQVYICYQIFYGIRGRGNN